MANYEINNIYDIATAFITDQNTTVTATGRNGDIDYKFIKRGLADYPYVLSIYAKSKAPQKRREKSYISPSVGDFVRGRTYIEKHYGEINLKRGTASSDGYGTRTLTEYTTKHEVGSALDKSQSDMKRFLTRIKSRKFFNLLDLAEKRISGQIKTTDNSKQIFDMIYRLKQNTK